MEVQMNKLLLSTVLLLSVMAFGLQGAAGDMPHRGDAEQQKNRFIKFFQAACLGEEGAIRYINHCLSNNLIDVNQQDGKGRTALYCAVANNLYDVATCLVQQYDANPNIVDNSGKSPLDIADARMRNILLTTPVGDDEHGFKPVAKREPVSSVPMNVVGGAQEVRVQPVRRAYRQTEQGELDLADWARQNSPRMSDVEKAEQVARWAAEAPLAQERFLAVWRLPDVEFNRQAETITRQLAAQRP
jgi:hypothetical protein